MNFWPCYRGTGGWVTFIAKDWREIRVKLPRGWRTRNYVGPICGGSLFGALDPMYMLMLIHLLGPDYPASSCCRDARPPAYRGELKVSAVRGLPAPESPACIAGSVCSIHSTFWQAWMAVE